MALVHAEECEHCGRIFEKLVIKVGNESEESSGFLIWLGQLFESCEDQEFEEEEKILQELLEIKRKDQEEI